MYSWAANAAAGGVETDWKLGLGLIARQELCRQHRPGNKNCPGSCAGRAEAWRNFTMQILSTTKPKSKRIPEALPNIPLGRGKTSAELPTGDSKGNLSNRLSTTATGRSSGVLNGGPSQAFSKARAKRLQDAPARFRQLYRRAWKRKSRKAAIRAFCLECVCWSPTEVTKCTAPACPLYEYRLRG